MALMRSRSTCIRTYAGPCFAFFQYMKLISLNLLWHHYKLGYRTIAFSNPCFSSQTVTSCLPCMQGPGGLYFAEHMAFDAMPMRLWHVIAVRDGSVYVDYVRAVVCT